MQDADAGMQKNSSVMTGFSIASIVVGIISFFQSLLMIGAAGLGAGLANMVGRQSVDRNTLTSKSNSFLSASQGSTRVRACESL